MFRWTVGIALFTSCVPSILMAQPRLPRDDAELRSWLQNMVWRHRFSNEEIHEALGLDDAEISAALNRFDIRPDNAPKRNADDPLLVLPYPGGRHPRIGFLNGAVDPQRETKISVFTPWDPRSYVVVDVPEAIWHQHGLLYLAHTHIDTVWSKQGIALEPLEWQLGDDGILRMERELPNRATFGTLVRPQRDGVRMEMWLSNGSAETLRDLRVQNCVMLKGAAGFTDQTKENKVLKAPYAAARSGEGKETRWIITGWVPNHRTWQNPPCPCLHSDPKFPDCAPGETQRLVGWLSFYVGDDIEKEFKRLDGIGWDRR
jgi:hypothetical protein